VPIGQFQDFEACVTHMMKEQGYSEEVAKKVCGKMQADAEGNSKQNSACPNKQPVALAFKQSVKFTEDPKTGDTIFHDVTLIAEGTWTDAHSRKATHYPASELEKMKFERMTVKMDHDIYDRLPLTNEIGIVENPRFQKDPARWLGDVRIFPTQNGKDISTLLKRGKITDISSEMFINPQQDKEKENKRMLATDLIFMGAATVRKGACTICKFNEGVDTTAEYTKEQMKDMLGFMKSNPDMIDEDMQDMMKNMGMKAEKEKEKENAGAVSHSSKGENMLDKKEGAGGSSTDPAIDVLERKLSEAVKNKGSDVAALEAQLEEVKKQKTNQAAAELEAAKAKIAELEASNKDLIRRVAEMEHDGRVRELQRQIAELSKQPVIHTRITTPVSAERTAVELDNEEFPAFSAKDFGE